MKFIDAMIKMQDGYKVTRTPWLNNIYFVIEDEHVRSYQVSIESFLYNEDILISDEWIVYGIEGTHKFYDITLFLQRGLKVTKNFWPESTFIYYDNSEKNILIHSMRAVQYKIDFDSFFKNDWIEIEKEEK